MNKNEEGLLVLGDESSDISLDLGCYSAASQVYTIDTMADCSTITLDPSILTTSDILTWSDNTYTTNYGFGPSDPNVNISHEGVNIKEEADLKIGDRSLKDFMDRVEDQLAILRPAPELEERWDQLKDLRRQYEECKQDILEKEKIMKILKED